eukprot:GHVS01059389.1.p1 GENE.GHVS01059389.1~~GHVS01059389.1.p1  ORF type:complete len:130 (-),score=3.51 GHVS01059389.1:366-755(-)
MNMCTYNSLYTHTHIYLHVLSYAPSEAHADTIFSPQLTATYDCLYIQLMQKFRRRHEKDKSTTKTYTSNHELCIYLRTRGDTNCTGTCAHMRRYINTKQTKQSAIHGFIISRFLCAHTNKTTHQPPICE